MTSQVQSTWQHQVQRSMPTGRENPSSGLHLGLKMLKLMNGKGKWLVEFMFKDGNTFDRDTDGKWGYDVRRSEPPFGTDWVSVLSIFKTWSPIFLSILWLQRHITFYSNTTCEPLDSTVKWIMKKWKELRFGYLFLKLTKCQELHEISN